MYAWILIVAITIGLSTGFAQSNASAPPFRTPGKVAVQLELTGEPKSLIQLIRASNLIIDGTVTGAMPPVSDTPPGRTPAILPKADPQLHAYDGTDVNTFLRTLSQTISHPYTDADTELPISPPAIRKP